MHIPNLNCNFVQKKKLFLEFQSWLYVIAFSISKYGHLRKLSIFDHLEQYLNVISPQECIDVMKIQYFDFI